MMHDEWRIVLSRRSGAALVERLALLSEAGIRTGSPDEAPLYVLDMNRDTLPVILSAVSKRRRIVLDWGDVPSALAQGSVQRRLQRLLETHAGRWLTGIVYRGREHRALLDYWYPDIPKHFAPDTVSDAWLDTPTASPPMDRQTIATFGTVSSFDASRWPAFYGAELLALLQARSDLTGIIVGRGTAAGRMRSFVEPLVRSGRLQIRDGMPLDDLRQTVSHAIFVTSYQTNDVAGRVRTTGKLPLVLGMGRGLLATDVGEASWALPQSQRLRFDRDGFVAGALRRIDQGWSSQDEGDALRRAEEYRRSRVAMGLRAWLEEV